MESKHLPSEKLLTPLEVPDAAAPPLRTPARRWRSSSHFHQPHPFGTVSKRRSRVNVVHFQLNLASNELFHILVGGNEATSRFAPRQSEVPLRSRDPVPSQPKHRAM